MLTCACGARFEVDDTLAGQDVFCPECQQPLKTPALDRPPQLTSGWALASVVLALVGAFTVVGTILAVLLGFYALLHIAPIARAFGAPASPSAAFASASCSPP